MLLTTLLSIPLENIRKTEVFFVVSVCIERNQWHEMQVFPRGFGERGDSPRPVAGKKQNKRW